MKLSHKPLILALVALAASPSAHAQLVTKIFNVTGVDNAVVTRFTMWINLNDDTVVVDIDNTLAAASSANVGTITGIGFNTPFAVADQGGDNPGSVEFKAKWTTGSALNLANGVWSNDDYWDEETPFALSPQELGQDYGVSAASPSPNAKGVEYGEKATFYFKFHNQDLTVANVGGFFDNNSSTNPYQFDFSVRWRQVDDKDGYIANGQGARSGSDKGGIDLTFTADGDLPATPEPSTYGLMGAAALLGLAAHRRHKAAKAAKSA